MTGAPYQYDVQLSAGGSFEHTIDDLRMDDGSDFPWVEYAAEYALTRGGSRVATIDQTSGVSVNPAANLMTFLLPSMPCPGLYEHALRFRHLATGKLVPFFDGTVTINESPF